MSFLSGGKYKRRILFAALIFLTIAGCGRQNAPDGQVIATVDGDELTMAQLETLLDDPANARAAQNPALRAKAVNSLIDETLFMHAAEREEIDRDPAVVRAIEKVRRAVLAQAYIRKIIPNSPIGPDEIRRFYDNYPQFFKQRRRYLVTDLLVKSAQGTKLEEFVAPLGISLTLEQLIAEMRRRKAEIEIKNFEFSSDGISPDLATQFARIAQGQSYSFSEGGWRHFGRVEALIVQPIPFASAVPAIRNRILTQRVEAASREKLDALRRSNTVVMGELGKKLLGGQSLEASAPPAPAIGKLNENAKKRAIERGLDGL